MKKYLIFDMDWTLIQTWEKIDKLIIDTITKYFPDIEEAHMRWVIHQIDGTGLEEAIKIITWSENKKLVKQITDEIIDQEMKNPDFHNNFFPWVIDLIKKLSKDYKLYLSTGNSTEFAIKELKQWWILELFEVIQWSTHITKSPTHIDIFVEHSWDSDFTKKSIFIWDWANDRYIAQYFDIPFIHIWSEWVDTYEVEKTTNITKILKNFV